MSGEQPWVPLSLRDHDDESSWHVLYEGVPAHLAVPLETWARKQIDEYGLAATVQLRLRLDLGRSAPTAAGIIAAADGIPSLMLDVVDLLLTLLYECHKGIDSGAWTPESERRKKEGIGKQLLALYFMLHDASSAHTVDLAGVWSLVRRVDATAEAAAGDVIEREGHAAALIKAAWKATFQRDADLEAAYRASVLAVESVACATFNPDDKKPTLGKAIAHLGNTLDRWTVADLDEVQQASSQTLLAMLRTIWHNHERHVGQGGTPPEPVTIEEAEAVLFLAVTVVQWFERGFVRRLDR